MTPDPCTNCGDPRLHEVPDRDGPNYRGFLGWCVRCYRRWRDNGKPAGGPPPPRRSGGPGPWRVEEYQFLRSALGGSLSRTEAARRLGVTMRTARRYEVRLQAQDPSAALTREAITKGEAA